MLLSTQLDKRGIMVPMTLARLPAHGTGHGLLRVCVVCGESLDGMRRHALFCGPPCRAEGSRLKRILAGAAPDGYPSLAGRLEAARNRTRGGSGGPNR